MNKLLNSQDYKEMSRLIELGGEYVNKEEIKEIKNMSIVKEIKTTNNYPFFIDGMILDVITKYGTIGITTRGVTLEDL